MRDFLERHSSMYRWAGREKARTVEELSARLTHSQNVLAAARLAHAKEADQTAGRHAEEIARHDAANTRLRRTNRDLVARLRDRGVAAEEYPAGKCPGCGSLAAFPEDHKHQIGTVSYAQGRKRLFCDGSEE